jgi:hypothetical protein
MASPLHGEASWAEPRPGRSRSREVDGTVTADVPRSVALIDLASVPDEEKHILLEEHLRRVPDRRFRTVVASFFAIVVILSLGLGTGLRRQRQRAFQEAAAAPTTVRSPPPQVPGPPPSPPSPPAPPFECAARGDASQCDALRDLFFATGGPSAWRAAEGWVNASSGLATDYCSFTGVTCSRGSINVTALCAPSLGHQAARAEGGPAGTCPTTR